MAWPTYSRTTLKPAALGHLLDGPAHLVEGVALDQLLDAGPQAALGHLEQLLGLLGDGPDAHGEGGVAVVALDDGAAVDGEDVPLLEHVAPRDAVHDHGVGRGADDGREAVVAEEVRRWRPGARAPRGPPYPARRSSRPAWRRRGSPRASRPRPCRPGASWPARPRCASRQRRTLRRWRWSSMAPTTRRVTASGEPVPLISTSRLTLLVPVEQRRGLDLVEVETALDGLLGVVLALDHLAAAHVAGPVDQRRGRRGVVGAAVDADPARGQALHDQVGRHHEVDHQVEAEGLDELLQRLGLPGRARAPVEHEAATGGVALGQARSPPSP